MSLLLQVFDYKTNYWTNRNVDLQVIIIHAAGNMDV